MTEPTAADPDETVHDDVDETPDAALAAAAAVLGVPPTSTAPMPGADR